MSGKSRSFAVAAVTAGVIGLWAPAAMAATGPSSSGDNGGVASVSHDQVPVQLCNDNVPVNVLGVQVPVNHVTGAGSLLSPGSQTSAGQDTSCHQPSGQINDSSAGTSNTAGDSAGTMSTTSTANGSDPSTEWSGRDWRSYGPSSSGDNAGVINISHDQVPIQACNDQVPVNVLGVQVPVYDVVAALGILSPISSTTAGQDNSCHQASDQANGSDS
jgi:hypothetical protein